MTQKTAIAIDLGGTKIKLGLVRGDNILARTQVDSNSGSGLRGRLPVIKQEIDQLLAQQNLAPEELAGVGISVPGIVDSVQKKILSINDKFNDAPDLNLSNWAYESWKLPLALENDARTAMIGEWKYGQGKGYDNVVLMTLGTGIGTSAVIEGNLLRGKHFLAGCLGGHFTINLNGRLCNCGNYGCVEVESSTWNIESKVKAHPQYAESSLSAEPSIDFKVLFAAAEKEDALARKVLDESLDIWAACAVNLIHAYDPEMLVLSGGIMGSSEYIIPYIQQKVNKHAWTPWGKVSVRASSFMNGASLVGAGYLVSNLK